MTEEKYFMYYVSISALKGIKKCQKSEKGHYCSYDQ